LIVRELAATEFSTVDDGEGGIAVKDLFDVITPNSAYALHSNIVSDVDALILVVHTDMKNGAKVAGSHSQKPVIAKNLGRGEIHIICPVALAHVVLVQNSYKVD
jgi:hypothetical protein